LHAKNICDSDGAGVCHGLFACCSASAIKNCAVNDV
jgi:hypothetical protein